MRYSKRLFTLIAMVLCISLFTGTVSHAEETIQYEETKYDCPVKKLKFVEEMKVGINSSGRVEFSIFSSILSGRTYNVTYNSKGKKKVETIKKLTKPYCNRMMKAYGGRLYQLEEDNVLRVYDKKARLIKKIKINEKKYRKRKKDKIDFMLLEIRGKNIVRVCYGHHRIRFIDGSSKWTDQYGGIIDIDISKNRIKNVIKTDFCIDDYDGKHVYSYDIVKNNMIFYNKSLKTKKTKMFTTEKITFDEVKYECSEIGESLYNGKIMLLIPDGRIFYGDFDSEKIEQIGDISRCKNFKKYELYDIEMKSKNEFYVIYTPAVKRGEEYDHDYGRVFLARYKKEKKK